MYIINLYKKFIIFSFCYFCEEFQPNQNLRDSLGGNLGGNKVNRILGNNDILGGALVKLGNGAGILIFALDQQLFSVFLDTDKGLFIQRGGPIVEHNRFIFDDG